MKQTANFKLKKPDYTDVADIADINANMDIIDTELKKQQDSFKTHTDNISNPHKVTKAQVGLGNVDNTADAVKNVLSATKITATMLKSESLNSITEIGNYYGAGGNSVTDFPTGASTNGTAVGGFTLVVYQAGGAGRLQIYTSDKGIWFRVGSLSGTTATWNGWIKVYNSASSVKINNVIFNGNDNIIVTADPVVNKLTNEDLNTIITSGDYTSNSANTCLNKPNGVTAFGLRVYSCSITGSYMQIMFTPSGISSVKNKIWVRAFESNTWKPWEEIYTTSNKPNGIPYFSCNEKIADGLDVYKISSLSSNISLAVNDDYGVGATLGIMFDSDCTNTGDVVLNLTLNGTTIHTGIIDDSSDNSICSFEGNVLYKLTLKANGYKCEKSEENIVATIETDRTIKVGDICFLDFSYAGNIYDGIKLQTIYNAEESTALYLYDSNGKKVTSVETNKMYLIKKRSNGFYMMKIGF